MEVRATAGCLRGKHKGLEGCFPRRCSSIRMWTVVYIAPNLPAAEMIKELLEKEGVLIMLRPVGAPHLGASGNYEILVPELEVEEAHEIISGFFGS